MKFSLMMFLTMTLLKCAIPAANSFFHFNELKHVYDGTITRQKATELSSKLA